MPRYDFQCFECGVQFEALLPMSRSQEPQHCPSCETPAERMMPDDVSGHFNKSVTGPVPQNTGISQLDAHIDRTIGTSAKQGWDEHNRRVQEKRKILSRPENKGTTLSRNPDGSYRPLTLEERKVQARALNIHEAAMNRRKPAQ